MANDVRCRRQPTGQESSSALAAYWHNQTGDGDTRRHPLQKVKAAGMEPTADEYRSTNYRLS